MVSGIVGIGASHADIDMLIDDKDGMLIDVFGNISSTYMLIGEGCFRILLDMAGLIMEG